MLQGEIHKLLITGLNNEGEGVVRVGDEKFVLFVPDALPGEEVTCRIITKKKNYGTAKIISREYNSPDRVKPLCPAFGLCGGCQLQHLNYQAQLKLKTQTVYDALHRIGGIEFPEVEECIPSPSSWGYRNKAALPVQDTKKDNFLCGFYKSRSHDIIPFKSCPVLSQQFNKNIQYAIAELKNANFSGYRENNITSFIRHLVFRNTSIDELLFGVVGSRNPSKTERSKLITISKKFPGHIKGTVFNRNAASGNFIWGDTFTALTGEPTITENLGKFKFQFEISSFFQINTAQTLNLYNYAAKAALENSPENILELYSGVGSLTAFLADGTKSVTAVESWIPAAKYIEINAKNNSLGNITPHTGKAEEIAAELTDKKYETVVIDPPRTGCAPEVINAIAKISPQNIVYVSCNPATLARDVKLLISAGYTLKKTAPFDMFPQTGHVETVVLMSRVKE